MSAVHPPTAGSDPAAPRARLRRLRGGWTDLRFILGVVLIVASVVGVWAVVTAARRTAPVYATSHTIAAGHEVTAEDLTVVQASLGSATDAYLAPGAKVESLVATRTMGAGELVPASAVIPAAQSTSTTVVVHSTADVPRSVVTGSTVELWVADQKDRGVYDVPRILIPDATVASVSRDDSVIGGGSAALELVIPRSEVADTLAAIASESAMSVVPTEAPQSEARP